MVSIRRAALILASIFLPTAHAGPVEVGADGQKKYADAFEMKQSATHTFECTLRQTLKLQGMKKPVISKGHIYYAAPDHLLIRFDEPSDEFVLLNGKHVTIKKSGEDAEERDLDPKKESDSTGIAMLLGFFQNGASALKESHRIAMFEMEKLLNVTLTPKQPDRRPIMIVTHLSLPDLELHSQLIRFSRENEMSYEFIQPQRDQPLKEGIFDQPVKGATK